MPVGRTNRRAFIAGLGGAAAWPLVARGQQAAKVASVGYLAASSEAGDRDRRMAFVQRFNDLGWVEGRGAHLEYR
jgi:putative ABC transport system substrate-binding protein